MVRHILFCSLLWSCTTPSSHDSVLQHEPVKPVEPATAANEAPAKPVEESKSTEQTSDDSILVKTQNRNWGDEVLLKCTPVNPTGYSNLLEPEPAMSQEAPLLLDSKDYDLASVPSDPEAVAAAELSAKAEYTVVSNGLNVRTGPSMSYPVARTLGQGDTVISLGQEGIWVQIGPTEYVSIRFLTPKAVTLKDKLTSQNYNP